jgi:hypothetical protein
VTRALALSLSCLRAITDLKFGQQVEKAFAKAHGRIFPSRKSFVWGVQSHRQSPSLCFSIWNKLKDRPRGPSICCLHFMLRTQSNGAHSNFKSFADSYEARETLHDQLLSVESITRRKRWRACNCACTTVQQQSYRYKFPCGSTSPTL